MVLKDIFCLLFEVAVLNAHILYQNAGHQETTQGETCIVAHGGHCYPCGSTLSWGWNIA